MKRSLGQSKPSPRICEGGLGLLLIALLLGACRPEVARPPARPNVILISIDTLRADHLGSYGYARDTSPFLDELAQRGVRFVNAFSPASWTLPAHLSLFTGCYPQSHGVEQDRFALPPDLPTFTETLAAAGYSASAFITWTYLKAGFGLGRGFERYEELLLPTAENEREPRDSVRATEAVGAVADWISSPPPEPFFLFVHLFDPHLGYEPPLEYAQLFDPAIETVERGAYDYLRSFIVGLTADARSPDAATVEHATDLYDGEIRFVDDQLRRLFDLLEERGLLEDSLVIVTSDHGEELGEHGSIEGHGWTLYDEVLRVPLIVLFPDERWAGRVEGRMVELIDVAPTVLDLLQLPPLLHAEGASLMPLLTGTAESWEELAFSHIRRFNKKMALRTPTHKLIYTEDTGANLFGQSITPGFELYDLEADPLEHNNLFGPESQLARELAARLQQLLASKQRFAITPAPELSAAEQERLRALGYIQ